MSAEYSTACMRSHCFAARVMSAAALQLISCDTQMHAGNHMRWRKCRVTEMRLTSRTQSYRTTSNDRVCVCVFPRVTAYMCVPVYLISRSDTGKSCSKVLFPASVLLLLLLLWPRVIRAPVHHGYLSCSARGRMSAASVADMISVSSLSFLHCSFEPATVAHYSASEGRFSLTGPGKAVSQSHVSLASPFQGIHTHTHSHTGSKMRHLTSRSRNRGNVGKHKMKGSKKQSGK